MTQGIKTIIYPVKDIAAGEDPVQRAIGRATDHGKPYIRWLQRQWTGYRSRPQRHAQGMTGRWPTGTLPILDHHRSAAWRGSGGANSRSGCRRRQLIAR